MLKGFKEFIARGNVVEMAVGIIIGGAFKNIVDALVNGVINPLIAAPSASRTSRGFIVTFHGTDITFGVLLTAVINFLIMAFALYFFLVLPMNYLPSARKRPRTRHRRLSPKRSSSSRRSATPSPRRPRLILSFPRGGADAIASAPPCCIPAVLRDDAP